MASNGAPLRYAVDAMSDTPDGPPPRAGERRRLDSWKEIAAYLGRGIRTVQRWEREEGLPVHRLAHADRGSVFADPTELTEWWKSRQIAPAAKPSTAVDAPPEPRLQRVTTTTAATFWPSLSSDGRMVVYVSDAGQDGATPQVWLQQVGGAAVQLTTGMRECAEPAFSHDDTRVIFSAAADSTRHVYEVPTFGGQPRVLKRMARGARFSPDGKWLVYLAIDSHDAVRIVSATATNVWCRRASSMSSSPPGPTTAAICSSSVIQIPRPISIAGSCRWMAERRSIPACFARRDNRARSSSRWRSPGREIRSSSRRPEGKASTCGGSVSRRRRSRRSARRN